MTRLKCLNCGNVFDKKALTGHGTAGISGISFGYKVTTLLLWPLVLRVYAECPSCRQKGWIKVLKPWSKD